MESQAQMKPDDDEHHVAIAIAESLLRARAKRSPAWQQPRRTHDTPGRGERSLQVTRRELVRMYWGRQTRRWSNWAFFAPGLAIVVFGITVSDIVIIAIGVVYAIWLAGYTWVVVPSGFWRRLPQLRSEQTITVSDEGITTELVHSSARTDWDYWSKVEALHDAYLITADKRGWIVIPRRAFDSSEEEEEEEEEDTFRQITARHLNATLPNHVREPM